MGLLTATLVYHIYYIYGSALTLEVAELLQRQGGDVHVHVHVSLLAACEQVRRVKAHTQHRNEKLTAPNSASTFGVYVA